MCIVDLGLFRCMLYVMFMIMKMFEDNVYVGLEKYILVFGLFVIISNLKI